MIEIRPVSTAEGIEAVAALAEEIWNQHFPPIIGQAHVDYMLDRFQSVPAIAQQIHDAGYEYFLVLEGGQRIGYFALVSSQDGSSVQISKLYLRLSHRKQGLGKLVLQRIEDRCAAEHATELWLTVNKDNSDSIAFYERTGFIIAEASVADIGSGFVMDDYLMRKRVGA